MSGASDSRRRRVTAMLSVCLLLATMAFVTSAWIVQTLGHSWTYAGTMDSVGQNARVRAQVSEIVSRDVIASINSCPEGRTELAAWRQRTGKDPEAFVRTQMAEYEASWKYSDTWYHASWLSWSRIDANLRAGRSLDGGVVSVRTGVFGQDLKQFLIEQDFTPATQLGWRHTELPLASSRFIVAVEQSYPVLRKVPAIAGIAMAALIVLLLWSSGVVDGIARSAAAILIAVLLMGVGALALATSARLGANPLEPVWVAAILGRLRLGLVVMTTGAIAAVVASRSRRPGPEVTSPEVTPAVAQR